MSNYFFGEVFNSLGTETATYIKNTLVSNGVNATVSGTIITITDWNGLNGNIDININGGSRSNALIFINFEENNEMILACVRDTVNGCVHGRNNNDELSSVNLSTSNVTTRTTFATKSTINIVKIINSGNNDISFFNLYIGDAPISPNVIYTDEVGNKFIGINTRLLIKYEE